MLQLQQVSMPNRVFVCVFPLFENQVFLQGNAEMKTVARFLSNASEWMRWSDSMVKKEKKV